MKRTIKGSLTFPAFDGANNPKGLSSPRDFSVVREALLKKYTEEETTKFLFGNGERLLRLGWGKTWTGRSEE
jgi:microsomal dipeptidase-like Zn-dependent dipeptidase